MRGAICTLPESDLFCSNMNLSCSRQVIPGNFNSIFQAAHPGLIKENTRLLSKRRISEVGYQEHDSRSHRGRRMSIRWRSCPRPGCNTLMGRAGTSERTPRNINTTRNRTDDRVSVFIAGIITRFTCVPST